MSPVGRGLSQLTQLSTAASSLLQGVLPAVQLHAKGTTQRGGCFGVGDLHHVDVTVCGAEVAAVEGRHLGLGLLEGGPRSVLQYPCKLTQREGSPWFRDRNPLCTTMALTAGNAIP